MKREPELFLIGPLPPPMMGQANVTLQFEKAVRQRGLSPNVLNTSTATGVARLFRYLWVVLHLLRSASREDALYISVFANGGMWFTLAYCLVGKAVGARVVLHHHTRGHVERRRLAMLLICRLCPGSVHIVLCPYLGMRLEAQYSSLSRSRVVVLDNSFAVDERPDLDTLALEGRRIHLGHLGNLSMIKGFGRAAEIFESLVKAGVDVHFDVAGPSWERAATALVSRLKASYPDRFTYWGPLAGEAKSRFYDGVDVFVFLSLHPSEAHPMVLLEALAHGCAVVAFGVGCVSFAAGEGPHALVLQPADDYVAGAGAFVRNLQGKVGAVREAAMRQFRDLRARSAKGLDDVVAILGGGALG